MNQLKAFKYRIYPTKDQAIFLAKTFGCVRFVWNQLVANFNSYDKAGPNQPMSEKILKDKPEYAWLNEVISYALQQKRIDFEGTKSQFFNKDRKVKLSRMQFKSRGNHDSFRIPAASMRLESFAHLDGAIKLPKMAPIKLVVDRKFTGNPRSVTISRNPSGQYFASILVEENIELMQNTGRSIGIDLGLTHLAILSNGMKLDNPRWFRENQAKLKKAQQHLCRKTKGSNRRNKQRLKVARIHQLVTNQRAWFHHNFSTWLVTNFDNIITEDLNIKGMVKNHCLAKSISDAGWSKLVSMIEYKCRWYGKSFTKVDRFFASSKTCSACGVKASFGLETREWTCASCNAKHDRDLNAAVNILNRGLTDLYGFTSAELTDHRRREELSPEVPLPVSMASSMKRLAIL
jgi:putative transposase